MDDRLRYIGIGAAAVLCVALGVGLGWFIWGQHGTDGPRPEVRQADASLVLERKPTDQPGPVPQDLPRGSRETRRVEVTIQPDAPDCPPVGVRLSVIRDVDGGSRVIASSPDGHVIRGVDVPIDARGLRIAPQPWAAGVSFAGQQAWGVFAHRDIWYWRLGIEVNAQRRGGAEARVLIGWTF
jgi:hypothetical protein